MMDEFSILKQLSGNEYKVFRYLVLVTGEHKYIYGMTTETIMQDLELGYTTVYKALQELKKRGLLEIKGQKKFFKVLV